jgi:predicted secreted protein
MTGQDSAAGEVKRLSVQAGQPFPIHLWEDRTRGEQWVPSYDAAVFALVGDEYLRVAGNNAVDNGTRTFEFRALMPGEHRIVFEKRMGWKFTAEDRRVFLITASDGAGGKP